MSLKNIVECKWPTSLSQVTADNKTIMVTKVFNFKWYWLYRVVRTGPSADRYVDRPLPGSTIDWGCFHPITTRNQSVTVDFDRRRLLRGDVSQRRRKKRENLEIWRRSPSTIPIRHRRWDDASSLSEAMRPRCCWWLLLIRMGRRSLGNRGFVGRRK